MPKPKKPMMPSMEQVPTKKTWEEIVKDSKGQLQFLPDVFTNQAEVLKELRDDLNLEIKRIAKKEINLNVKTQNLFFEIRENLEKNGLDDVWVKDINFESSALKEGKNVLVIMDNKK